MGWHKNAKLDCGECREFYQKRRRQPPCDTHCNLPGLWEENFPAWAVLQAASGALFDGWGGINLANAKLTAEDLGYQWDAEMNRKILAAAMKIRENTKSGG